MARRRRRTERTARLALCALLAAPTIGPAQATRPSFAASDVRITITVAANGRAAVRETFTVAGDSSAADFEYLTVPCAVVGPVRERVSGTDVVLSRIDHAPWVRLRDSAVTSRPRGAVSLVIDYDVELSGREASVPVVHPAMPIQAARGYGAKVVHVDVSFENSNGTGVLLPQLARIGDGPWTGHFLAMPSVVRVDRGSASAAVPCDLPGGPARDSGAFEFIFFSFLATVALWVPLYLWWVSRQRDPERPGED
jgi:hypothetical protein